MRAELVRDISRSLRFLWFIIYLFRGRKNYYFGFPGVWTDLPVWPVRSEETLSWGSSRLRYCDPGYFGVWKIVMKWCTSFGTRLGLQVRDFSDCFGYFTKWDLTTSWYLEITSRHEISLRVLKNISRVSPTFELFHDEFKGTKCCTKTFCLCWVLRSKIAFMRCVTFSNVLYVF